MSSDRLSNIERRLDLLTRLMESQLTSSRDPSSPSSLSPLSTAAPPLGESSDSSYPTSSLTGTLVSPHPSPPALGLATETCWPPPITLPLPCDCTRKMKPIRKSLSDAGYFKPTFGLSKRNEKKEPVDLSTPWKSLYETAVQARILLGPRPDPSETHACEWFSKLETLFTAQQSHALYELALIKAKRIAPNLSKDRQVSIVTASWPLWSRMTVELHAAQERALTTPLLSRNPAGVEEKPAGKGK